MDLQCSMSEWHGPAGALEDKPLTGQGLRLFSEDGTLLAIYLNESSESGRIPQKLGS